MSKYKVVKDAEGNSKLVLVALSDEQIAWASQHDWFLRASQQEGYVVVRDWTKDGEEVQAYFSDFAKLRAWAGY